MKKKVKVEYKYLKREYSYVFGMMIFFSSTFFWIFDYIINKKLDDFYFESLELQTYSIIGAFLVFIMMVLFFIPSERKIKFIFFNTIFISSIFMAILIFLTLYYIAYNMVFDKITKIGQENYFQILIVIGLCIIGIFISLVVIPIIVSKLKKIHRQ